MIRYRPEPGSTESRVVELLRFLPNGTALHGADLDARLGLGERRGLHMLLKASVDHGLLMAEKREHEGRLLTYWSAVRPTSIPAGQVLK